MNSYNSRTNSRVFSLVANGDWKSWFPELQSQAIILSVWKDIDPQTSPHAFPPPAHRALPVYADARLELLSMVTGGKEPGCSDVLAYLKMMRDDYYWRERKAEAEREERESGARTLLKWVNETVHPDLKNTACKRAHEGAARGEVMDSRDILRGIVKELKYMTDR